MWSNTKILDRIVYFWLQCDGKEAELQRHSLPIVATESGASWLAERAPMMHVSGNMVPALRACRWRTAENPVSNRGPSIRQGKKRCCRRKGSFKDCFSYDGVGRVPQPRVGVHQKRKITSFFLYENPLFQIYLLAKWLRILSPIPTPLVSLSHRRQQRRLVLQQPSRALHTHVGSQCLQSNQKSQGDNRIAIITR